MKVVWTLTSWLFTVVFAFLALLVWGMGGRLPSVLILGIALILVPPLRAQLRKRVGRAVPWWAFALTGVALWGGVLASFALNPAQSIYKSPQYERELQAIYDEKLAQWPVPYETRYVDTRYGKIHVIASGPEDGFPVLLLNASALAGWSWIHNVQALSGRFRSYAIDNVGEGGKNQLRRPGDVPKSEQEIALLYAGICDALKIEKANVIGASVGGYLATSFARHAPERVHKLVLLGPMGFGFTAKTIAGMTLAQGFPIAPVQKATFRWAFGDSPRVRDSFERWFRLYMKGLVPTPVRPRTFTPEALSELRPPTLVFLGTRDGVVGDAEAAAGLARSIPDVEIRLVDSGHVIGAELADAVNPAITAFLAD
jgi:pimeloyl-ACP methyl ester carboxylesterase